MEHKNSEKQKMRKTNMKIFPIYKKLSWDYLFFYTIDFLFLTQIKNISAADVVLKSSFYAFFSIFLQIPVNIIVDFLGRKNSIVFGSFLNCFYMVIIMLSRNLPDLIFAEFISAIAFSIKNIADPSLLHESIPPSKYKSEIFATISAKGATGYYIYNAISKVIAGYLYVINGYLPIIVSLIILIIVAILSLLFIEPVQKKNVSNGELTYLKSMNEITEGFKYILKSNRLKALILEAALLVSLLAVLTNYTVSLLEDMKISSIIIGIISAIGSVVSAIASKKENEFNKKFKNKSLITISLLLSISTLVAGICAIPTQTTLILFAIIVISILIYNFCYGMYYTIIDRYLSNFSNKNIDTKIFAAKNLIGNAVRFLAGIVAAFLIDKMSTAYCMIIMGIFFTIIYLLMGKYMSTRVGKKPEEYSREETKYDELKNLN